jgi:hypothetical protein
MDRVSYHGGSSILRFCRVERSKYPPFEKEPFLESFDKQNAKIEAYFISKPHLKFLKTDVTRSDFDPRELASFLGLDSTFEFPHLNQSR